MINQRIYTERPQTTDMKVHITNNYIENIAPHELMVEAIKLQNQQIYALQFKYLQLLSQTKQAKNPSQYTEQEQNKIQTFKSIKINEHKKFIEEGLKANQIKYLLSFQNKKAALLQVLANKETMHKQMKGHQMNVFFNLDENILNELIDQAAKSENVDENKRIEFIEQIKWWKRRLEVNEKELAQTQ